MPHDSTASRTSSAPWPTTTMILEGFAARTTWRVCHRTGRPQTGWSTLGRSDRSRFPRPAARTTAASDRGVRFGVVATAVLQRRGPGKTGVWSHTATRLPGRSFRGEEDHRSLTPVTRPSAISRCIADAPGRGVKFLFGYAVAYFCLLSTQLRPTVALAGARQATV